MRAADAPTAPVIDRTVTTRHTVRLADGTDLAYTATAGTLVLRDEHQAPQAEVFFVAYTTGDRARPVTFCSNGGPGSSSVWLHLGSFGPRRIVTSAEGLAPLVPLRLADNGQTLLDVTDLVFIDAVGTGYSTLAGKGADGDFYGVDEDLRAFSQFIRRWIAAAGRGASPVFLLGESYGTFRNAALAGQLQSDGTPVRGVILLSTLLDYGDDFSDGGSGANLVDAFAIPTEAAVAWYHKQVPDPAPDVATAALRARTFTDQVYLPAVLSPTPLDDAQTAQLAQALHALIGLDPAYLVRAQLRVTKERFESELLRAQGRIVGRYDGRIDAVGGDRNRATPDFDPSFEAIAPAFTTAFGAYAKDELHWQTDQLYRALPPNIVGAWNFKRDGFDAKLVAPSTLDNLRDAMLKNPALFVFSGSGWYDLATPFYGTEYEFANVGLEPSVRARISSGIYPAGHMIYLSSDALPALRADLGRFYATALEAGPR